MNRRIFVTVLCLAAMATAITCWVNPAHAGPGGGTYYANSPAGGATGTAIRKFVDSLAGICDFGQVNNLGQCIPVAKPNKTLFLGDDYYEIGLQDFTEQMHSDLPATGTKLRGYYQINAPAGDEAGVNHYLGPLIIAERNRPVRVKFVNNLPAGGNLFIPTDHTIMGAGMGPLGAAGGDYPENRATLHLHGGLTPWISDGTAHQWTAPVGETSPYTKGVSTKDVPDMLPAGDGAMTFYYPNDQSNRLMFYHDHAYGITRLNVYAGEAAGYLLRDPQEKDLELAGVIPPLTANVPLIIQDKSFVPNDIAVQDAKWDTAAWGGPGNLWFPHVYEPNQDPTCTLDPAGSCMNPMGRWDYAPWIWPPQPVNFPLPCGPDSPNGCASIVPEAYMDTMVVNGTAYPYMNVERKAYRFRILNGSNDRFLNLQLYYAATGVGYNSDGTTTPSVSCKNTTAAPAPPAAQCTEVRMVPANGKTYGTPFGPYTVQNNGNLYPEGVPNPATTGPMMVQIGNEGGFLPVPVRMNNPPHPIGYDFAPKTMTMGNVNDGTLILGTAERADVIIDFSAVPAGSTLILYNDAPAAFPAGDPRYDYYTGNADMTAAGGAPSTLPGFGPNTRTIMQFRVTGPKAAAFNFAALDTAIPAAYAASQEPPVVPETAYNAAFPGIAVTNTYAKIFENSLTFTPYGSATPVTVPFQSKAIAEEFDINYGRMSAMLGTEFWWINTQGQQTNGYAFIDPVTETIPDGEVQIWKIVHNGVDTHTIHWHLLNVQVVNRTDWAGVVKAPDPNELGWKETVRISPLEDTYIAVKAKKPVVPFAVPNSIRPLDPASPLGSQVGFTNPWPEDPTGTTITTNRLEDFGWEYVWHCHILGHEENDMMRPLVLLIGPTRPTNLVVTGSAGPVASLTWVDNSTNETGFVIERATNPSFTTGLRTFNVGANTTTYTDSTTKLNMKYYYRVFAVNAEGRTMSNIVTAGKPESPSGLTAVQPTAAVPVTLYWTDNAPAPGITNPPNYTRETQTLVLRRVTGTTAWTTIATLPINPGNGGMSYVDATTIPGTRYDYLVRASNFFGVSGSNIRRITTKGTPPVM